MKIMKMAPLLALLMLLGIGSTANAQISFGIRIGEPPAPRAYYVAPQPDPGYEWVEGYWYPVGGRWRWHDGYWTRPPFAGAYWVAPYHWGGQYYAGYWSGPGRNRFDHDHRWDRGRDRDFKRGRGRRDDRHDNRR